MLVDEAILGWGGEEVFLIVEAIVILKGGNVGKKVKVGDGSGGGGGAGNDVGGGVWWSEGEGLGFSRNEDWRKEGGVVKSGGW